MLTPMQTNYGVFSGLVCGRAQDKHSAMIKFKSYGASSIVTERVIDDRVANLNTPLSASSIHWPLIDWPLILEAK